MIAVRFGCSGRKPGIQFRTVMLPLRLRRVIQATALLLLVLPAAGCEDDGSTGTDGSTGSSTVPGVTITGSERLAWEQAASSQAEVDSYRFTVFVDGTAGGPLAASCSATGSTGLYSCAAKLPTLGAGAHRLAIQTTSSNGLSSGVSADVAVVVSAAGRSTSFVTALAASLPVNLAQVCLGTQPAQRCFELQRVATQLAAPTHPMELPDGRIMLVDAGRLMEVRDGQATPASTTAPGASRVADVSIPPDGAATREVYVLEVNPAGTSTSAADVVRYRVINGVFGERAVIVPNVAVPRDGDPVLLVDDQILVGVPSQQGAGGNRFGTVLRFDRRGASAGYRIGTPVLAWGAGQPTSLFKSGVNVGLAGLSAGNLAFGVLPPGATMPAEATLAARLTAAGGVRALQRVGNVMLLATGDGGLQLADAGSQGGMPTTLQRLDTRGVAVTGLGATRDGGIVATAMLPSSSGTPVGVVYRLTPVTAR